MRNIDMRSHSSVCQGSCTFQKPWYCMQFRNFEILPDPHWPQLAPERCQARATAMFSPAVGQNPAHSFWANTKSLLILSLLWRAGHLTFLLSHFPAQYACTRQNQPSCILYRSKTDLSSRTQVAVGADLMPCSDRLRHFGQSLIGSQGTHTLVAVLTLPFDYLVCKQMPFNGSINLCSTRGVQAQLRPLSMAALQRSSSSVQLSNVFVSNVQTQKGEIALDSLGQNVKESSSRQKNIILRGMTGKTPWKRGLVSAPLVKTLQKVSGLWERDYTHAICPGPKFFPHAEG